MHRLIFLLVLANVFALGKIPPEPASAPAPRQESKMTEWSGQNCGISSSKAVVVSNFEDWSALWKQAFGEKEVPAVDFNGHIAAAVFLGTKNTGGHGATFLDPESSGDKTILRYKVRAPGPGSFVTQAFTSPWAIKLFPKPAGQVSLEQTR